MKTFRHATAMLIIGMLASCSQHQSHMNVRRNFPYAQIESVPGEPYQWIVRSGTNTYHVLDVGSSDAAGQKSLVGYSEMVNITPLFGSEPIANKADRGVK